MTLPTLSLTDTNRLASAGDLVSLKQAAATNSPQALREAARQFESLFTSMVLKSMQQANFKDPLFGSDQGDLYQDMYDDQLAAVMSKGKGLGLADMLVQQLRRESAGSADSSISGSSSGTSATAASSASGATSSTGGTTATSTTTATGTAATAAGSAATDTASASAAGAATAAVGCPTSAQQAAFARSLWPDAQRAARQLGVNPVTLLAQAALETDWGRSVPQSADGGTSNNLFGIKAGPAWNGSSVTNGTQEYSGGAATTVQAQFRSYGSTSQCFQDYADLLQSNPRYAAALGTGSDVQAFASALQQGGYATDPSYASKLTAVAGTLSRAMTRNLSQPAALKFAAAQPTTSGSGPLQRR